MIWNKNSPHGKATEDQLEKNVLVGFFILFLVGFFSSFLEGGGGGGVVCVVLFFFLLWDVCVIFFWRGIYCPWFCLQSCAQEMGRPSRLC